MTGERPAEPSLDDLLDAVNAELADAVQPGSPYTVLSAHVQIGRLLGGLPDQQEIAAALQALRRMKGLAAALRVAGVAQQDPAVVADLIDAWLAPVFEAPR